jgi:hypothetical protein
LSTTSRALFISFYPDFRGRYSQKSRRFPAVFIIFIVDMFQLIRKDSGEGIVCGFRGGEALVAPIAVDDYPTPSLPRNKCAPGGCGSCGGCMTLASIPNGYARRFSVPISRAATYKIGDRVRYVRFIPEPNLMSALIFGLPVTFAMAAMLCYLSLAPQDIESPSAALCIAAAFFTGILIVGAVNNIFKKRYPPTIIGRSLDYEVDVAPRSGACL